LKGGGNMAYKIAVASTDGKVVNQHFGRADKFYIVEVNEKEEYTFLETRETGAACQEGNHSVESLENTVSLLSDCKYVLVSQIGPGAEFELSKKGISAFAISHYIDIAVGKLIKYNVNKKVIQTKSS
jgi:nitrogen fixation protein NifX